MQGINKTNVRSQIREKEFMLCVYKDISSLFSPLLKPEDEQPDTIDVPDLETEESAARRRNQLRKSDESVA